MINKVAVIVCDKRIIVKSGNVIPCKYVLSPKFYLKSHLPSSNLLPALSIGPLFSEDSVSLKELFPFAKFLPALSIGPHFYEDSVSLKALLLFAKLAIKSL